MTEQEFYQKLLAELDKSAEDDKQLSTLLDKIQSGQADFADSSAYWQKFSKLIGSVLSRNTIEAGSGLNEEVSYLMLKSGHMRAFEIMSMVQKALDQRQNIHINPVNPAFPEERARKTSRSLEDKTVSQEVIQRRAENAIANIANSFQDAYIKENANFRQKAGLTCYVNRIGASKCCAWCAEVAGRYEVSRAPADFWRRHDNCSCQIIYENKKVRQRLSGNGRAWKVDSEVQRRIAQSIQYKPTVFTQEQAKALEQQKLSQYKSLTSQPESGTIETEEQKRLRQMIADGTVSLTINPEVQNRHFYGTSERQEFLDRGIEKSYFLPDVTIETLQDFLNQNAGTGAVKFSKNGKIEEKLDFGRDVAFDTLLKRNTSFLKVQYSKKRTHFFPYSPKKEDDS
ncbi:MAG: hypothetical protein IJ644_04935 [Oscillospiraceae bacterium]|nr:hypothetical protein [Oscillospiraceae bacterium]